MKLKSIILLLLIFNSSCTNKELEIKFPNLEFDKVIAYKMKGMDEEVIEENKLSNNVEGENEILNSSQVLKLLTILNRKSTYGGTPAKCFEPHLGFVFYDEDMKVIAHSTICLACNWMSASPKVKEFVFSKKGSKSIANFKKEIFRD